MPRLARKCGYCGGDGRLSDGSTYCPHCDTHAKDIPVSLYEKPSRDLPVYVPIMATKKPFNVIEFDAYHNHLQMASEYTKFRAQLYDVVSKILQGDVPKTSCLIYMDNPDFTDRFASTYLVTAFRAGLKIFPFLDTSTLWQLKTNKNFKLPVETFGELNFYDAVNADVLCIDLVTQMELFTSAGIAHYLVTTRGRLNKPTIIFTTMSGSDLFRPDLLDRIPNLINFRRLVKSQKDNPSTCNEILYMGLDASSKLRR